MRTFTSEPYITISFLRSIRSMVVTSISHRQDLGTIGYILRLMRQCGAAWAQVWKTTASMANLFTAIIDRKSTRLNSSHVKISYAVFCLKKKNIEKKKQQSHKNIKI